MQGRVPPLNYLRPFEATARLGSTVLAAKELGRTHGAVSRQIKLLEDWLQTELFDRESGRLVLTVAGEHYFGVTTRILRLLEGATRSVSVKKDESILTIQCPSVFATRWLLPRMRPFIERHPELQISITGCAEETVPKPTDFDIVVLMSPVDWSDLDVTPLMPDFVFPVCEASNTHFAVNQGVLNTQLIRTKDSFVNWDMWFQALPGCKPKNPIFMEISDTEVALQAAAIGHGVVLGRGHLVFEDLLHARLRTPIRSALQIDTAYWLVTPHATWMNSAVKLFASYLRTESILSFDRLKRYLSTRTDLIHVSDSAMPRIQSGSNQTTVMSF